MFRRRRGPAGLLVAAGAALVLVLAGYGGGGGSGQLAGGAQPVGKQDLNPRDPATLRDGGDLRIAEDQLPDNWNHNQVDGPNVQAVDILTALYPRVFDSGPLGTPVLNTNYVSSAEVTGTNPQVVTYKINPQASWDSGRPITWEDFAAQWRALNGGNPAYQAAATTGYQDISAVERGADDKEVEVTFSATGGEWQALFGFLLPKELNADPDTFNTGWVQRPADSAGPFAVESIDATAKTVILARNPKWWGPEPRLDRIVYRVYERAAMADAAANNEIDYYVVGSSVDLFQRARTTPGMAVRQAPNLQYSHITFNGAPGSTMENVDLRLAIMKGIDRRAIVARVGPIVPDPQLMGSHIYPFNSENYRDNAGPVANDAAAANADLDRLGWVRPTPEGVRAKDGKELSLRFVVPANNPISDQVSTTVLDQLARTGVQITIEAVPTAGLFDEYVNRGNFDLTGFQWESTPTPLSSAKSLYDPVVGGVVAQNKGSVSSPELTATFGTAVQELDPAKRAALGNEIDAAIWRLGHHLPLFPGTGAVAVRDTLANFGAKGFADWDWIPVGFVQQ